MLQDRGQRYRYYALIASKWVREASLSEMIRDTLEYNQKTGKIQDVNKVIRELIDNLNSEVRFYYVRNVKCYCDLLLFEFERRRVDEESYPNYTDFGLPNYLELGMSHLGTIQLHNIGLSRTSAIELNRYCQRSGVAPDKVFDWVRIRAAEIAQQMPRPIKVEMEKVFAFG